MKHLVVARWQEDVSWLDDVSGWEIRVVQKDVDLPNQGRESSSYFLALAQTRWAPDDRVCFVQGDPFAHCPFLLADLDRDYSPGFHWLGDWHVECDLNGNPHHGGLPIVQYSLEWFGQVPDPPIEFTAGAQFVVDGETILGIPESFYESMVSEMSRDHAPWVMERLWRFMFERCA